MEGKSIIGQIGVVFGTLLAIAVILYLAYAATKLLGKRFSVRGGGSKKIKILDSVSVGQGKTILIVQTGGKSNEFLCDGDVLQPQTMDFKTAFKKVLENNFGRKNSNKEENENGGSDKK